MGPSSGEFGLRSRAVSDYRGQASPLEGGVSHRAKIDRISRCSPVGLFAPGIALRVISDHGGLPGALSIHPFAKLLCK